jgi:phenylalanyl-tRNA synthetase alpha chain
VINEIKKKLDSALLDAAARIQDLRKGEQLAEGRCDVTLPGRRQAPGLPHPLRIVEAEIIDALTPLGFEVVDGRQVEHDWYNFEALNLPEDHPARDMQDTFFLGPQVVLRTHTSNVQIRTMVERKPPVRILAPGMVFRNDDVDPTHSPVFHQIEGLWIDEGATFADLKGVLKKFATELFGPATQLRLRPSFFPFTEPSAEVDVTCIVCSAQAADCRVCKGTGWLEILGAGMVDPAVMKAVGYDPDRYQGFAFGAGIERIAMLRWGVDDIRLFYENDRRFLEQFGPGGR